MKYVLLRDITPFFIFDKNYYIFLNSFILFFVFLSIIKYKYYSKRLIFILIINIILEILFNIYFLLIVNPFFMFVTKLIQFIFSINLNEEIYYNKTCAKLLIPYILWSFILSLTTISILFLNR